MSVRSYPSAPVRWNVTTMALSVGTKLGPYEVINLLGAGGMGEVYRARDTRLERHVALKLVLESFVADRERTLRFEREAKTLASLNHPNIATLHGIEQVDGRHFLVMELVEGETLAARIAQYPAGIPIDDTLQFARQIAEALEAAHEKGIVHRDLKPANIHVTPDGKVKVLDFGLARIAEPEGASSMNVAHSPTMSALATHAGVILGTASYMSPEQAGAMRPITAATSSRSAWFSTKCSAAASRSLARRSRMCSHRYSRAMRICRCFRPVSRRAWRT